MSESSDMDAPVTRRELHQALEMWAGTIEARASERERERDQRMVTAMLTAIKTLVEASELRVMTELRAVTKASGEELATRLAAVDEQYKDLPLRVRTLEAKVFAPRRPRRRVRARRRR